VPLSPSLEFFEGFVKEEKEKNEAKFKIKK